MGSPLPLSSPPLLLLLPPLSSLPATFLPITLSVCGDLGLLLRAARFTAGNVKVGWSGASSEQVRLAECV